MHSWTSTVSKQSDFLELLKNPQRVRIKKLISDFTYNIQYYAWDLNVHVHSYQSNGTHAVRVESSSEIYFNEINRMVNEYFKPSDDYWLNVGPDTPHIEYAPPDGDLIYTRRFQVIER